MKKAIWLKIALKIKILEEDLITKKEVKEEDTESSKPNKFNKRSKVIL